MKRHIQKKGDKVSNRRKNNSNYQKDRTKIKSEFKRIKQVTQKITQQVKKEVHIQKQKIRLKQQRTEDLFEREQICKHEDKSICRQVEIPLKQLKNAIKVLNIKDDSEYEHFNCKKNITELVNRQNFTEYAPSSYTALCYEIQRCLLSHDWSNLTEYLILLLDGPVSFKQIKWKVAMLVLLHNPYVHHSGILEDFLKMCACCQTEYAMEDFLQKVLVLQDELKSIPPNYFNFKAIFE